MLLHRVRPDLYRTNIDIAVLGDFKEFKEEETPGFAISVLTAMMPVILIAIATICSFILPESNPVNEAIQVVGAPDAAMLLPCFSQSGRWDSPAKRPCPKSARR